MAALQGPPARRRSWVLLVGTKCCACLAEEKMEAQRGRAHHANEALKLDALALGSPSLPLGQVEPPHG